MRLAGGEVALSAPHDGEHALLKGLEFHSPPDTPTNTAAEDALQGSHLSFLALVETAKVPWYLASGPALEVYTADERTESKLFSLLVGLDFDSESDFDSHDLTTYESTTAILLQLWPDPSSKAVAPAIDQLLIYASSACSPRAPSTSGLITPPRSSSPARPSTDTAEQSPIRLFALPLRSEAALRSSLATLSPPPSPNNEPYFVDVYPPTPRDGPPAKRPRLNTVLSGASGARSTSGRGVSKLMAGLDGSRRNSLSLPAPPADPAQEPATLKGRKRPKAADPDAADGLSRAPLSRSYTTGQLPGGGGGGGLLHRRTGSLHRVASLANLPAARPPSARNGTTSGANSARASPAPTDGSRPGTRDGRDGGGGVGLDAQNKNVLSRCVMAGLRLRGWAPARGKKGAEDESGEGEEAQRRADEYKALYHQTFRGAGFALRRRAAAGGLEPERVREVVEKLLELFCGDEAE